MKYKTAFISYIITLLSSVCIFAGGYYLLAYAGENLMVAGDGAVPLSKDFSDTYVFLSETDDSLVLYPWNHFHDVVPFYKYYNSDYSVSDVINVDGLYESIEYYWYRMLPEDTLNTILSYGLSLSNQLDFSNIEQYIYVKKINNETIHYYSKGLNIGGKVYNLKCAFNDYEILSFQIAPVNADQEAAPDSSYMDSSKKFLSDYIHSSKINKIPLIFYDILNCCYIFDSYSLGKTSNAANQSTNDLSVSEIEIDGAFYNEKLFDTNISYQLVASDNEILIILIEYNSVLHYDPVSQMITGFNKVK